MALKVGMPNNIQVELVEGCNRMCRFCGINGIWQTKEDRVVRPMDTDLAIAIAEDFGTWAPARRIEFAMHGEPTLHPELFDIVQTFRDTCPQAQLQLTTNGIVLRKQGPSYVKKLFDVGLNILLVDTYTHHGKAMEVCMGSGVRVYDYYADKDCPNPYHNNGPGLQAIIMMGNLGAATGKKAARKILNHAGNVPPETMMEYNRVVVQVPLIKKCSRPFRELSVHYDGTVSVCCMDWKHEFVVGVFKPGGSLLDIWEGVPFQVARQFLGNGQRAFRPCYKCDYNGGFRLGFLPKVQSPSKKERVFLKGHFEKFDKYAHRNADGCAFFKHPATIGLKRFF